MLEAGRKRKELVDFVIFLTDFDIVDVDILFWPMNDHLTRRCDLSALLKWNRQIG